ncbi:MAG: hypothetical protein ABI481_02685 [Pyrinomonadaceae bacterium]
MPQYEYCPPFGVFNGTAPTLKPLVETQSLKAALWNLQSRPNSNLRISVLVTDGDVSTLIPVTLSYADLDGKKIDDAQQIIESYAERRFRSMLLESKAAASA